MGICWVLKRNTLGKASCLNRLSDGFLDMTGGIPVDRTKHNSLVTFTAEMFNQSEELVVGIAPEGTRKRVKNGNKGFII